MLKKPYLIFSVTIFFTIIILILLFWPLGMQLVVKEKNGKQLIAEQVLSGDVVSIKFIHSVEKVNVTETYIIQGDKTLLLKKSLYGSTGAGLPSDASHNIKYKDGQYLIEDYNETFRSVEFVTGDIPKHTIKIHNTEYPIYKMSEDGKHLSIFIEYYTPINYFWQ